MCSPPPPPASAVTKGRAAGRCTRNWSRYDTAGAIALVLGFLFVVNHVVFSHVHEWQVTTQYFKNRMIDFGLDAGLLAVDRPRPPARDRRHQGRSTSPAPRASRPIGAFAAWTGTADRLRRPLRRGEGRVILAVFATLWEERPMIFLCPLLLIGTALVFEARRIDRRLVAGAAGFVLLLVLVQGDPARLALLRGSRLGDPRRPELLPPLDDAQPAARAARRLRARGAR